MSRRPGAIVAAAASAALLAACARPASAERIEDVQCPASCATDLDCSLNGVCGAGGVCACDAAWTGPCCTALNLLPVATAANGGYRHANTSTWGGNIIPHGDGKTYSMWIAEMAPKGVNGDAGAGSCGLTTWWATSQITHVVSNAGPLGPYARADVAVGVWSHNPMVRRIAGDLVLYHIGDGSNSSASPLGYCAMNGTSPCGEQSFDQCANATCSAVPGYACLPGYCSGDSDADCGADIAEPSLQCDTLEGCAVAAGEACDSTPGCLSFGLSVQWGLGKAKLFSAGKGGAVPNPQWSVWYKSGAREAGYPSRYARAAGAGRTPPAPAPRPDGSCDLPVHLSVSGTPAGPWVLQTNVSISPCGGNNPGPWVHPNGTIYLVVTDGGMSLYRADTWRGPYTLVTTGACGGGEDPSLFIDARGHFHCLFHRAPFSNPDIAIGHSYSVDGLTWYVAAEPAANSTIEYEGLGPVVHGKRERPHVYVDDATGAIAGFVTGVCINPACDPFEGGGVDPAAACDSATQYHHCDANSPDGWYDRTYTLVQGVVTPTPAPAPARAA